MKVITLTGLEQVDDLPKGRKCTPVEDATMAGEKVIRCKEDVMELEAAAPEKVATLAGTKPKRQRRKNPGHKLGSVDKPCVPEWVAMRSRGGRQVQRCHCKGGRFIAATSCPRKK